MDSTALCWPIRGSGFRDLVSVISSVVLNFHDSGGLVFLSLSGVNLYFEPVLIFLINILFSCYSSN